MINQKTNKLKETKTSVHGSHLPCGCGGSQFLEVSSKCFPQSLCLGSSLLAFLPLLPHSRGQALGSEGTTEDQTWPALSEGTI